MQLTSNILSVYVAPECVLCTQLAGEAILADSYHVGGGGSYTGDDIVDNGNY